MTTEYVEKIKMRVWSKTKPGKEGCVEWTGAKSKFGHGRIKINGKLASPHRLVWEWFNGDIPEGQYILHKCDNPGCLNPDHLFIGTQRDNVMDAINKGRHHTPAIEAKKGPPGTLWCSGCQNFISKDLFGDNPTASNNKKRIKRWYCKSCKRKYDQSRSNKCPSS